MSLPGRVVAGFPVAAHVGGYDSVAITPDAPRFGSMKWPKPTISKAPVRLAGLGRPKNQVEDHVQRSVREHTRPETDPSVPTTRHRYRWIGELKFEQAQRDISNFAAYNSRVGLDEFEWVHQILRVLIPSSKGHPQSPSPTTIALAIALCVARRGLRGRSHSPTLPVPTGSPRG